jgi:hypothetical protein
MFTASKNLKRHVRNKRPSLFCSTWTQTMLKTFYNVGSRIHSYMQSVTNIKFQQQQQQQQQQKVFLCSSVFSCKVLSLCHYGDWDRYKNKPIEMLRFKHSYYFLFLFFNKKTKKIKTQTTSHLIFGKNSFFVC